jgi:hypothetical protein
MTAFFTNTFSLPQLRLFARTHWVTISLLGIVLLYLGTVTILHTQATSPIDEWLYLDYLVKIPQHGMLFSGEIVSSEVLTLMSCHGTSPFGPIGTPCGETPVLSDYPNQGITSASIYTPIYFYTTFGLGWVISQVFGLPDVTGWRLVGLLWAAVGIAFYVVLMRRWGVRNLTILALGIAFLASPFAWWSFTYVSTDAPALLFGALLFLLATRVIRREAPSWVLIVTSVVVVLVKPVFIIGVGAVALFLLAEFVADRCRHRHNPTGHSLRYGLLRDAVLMLIVPSVMAWAWSKLVSLLAVSGAVPDQGTATRFTVVELLTQFTNFLPMAINTSAISEYIPGFVFQPLGWLTLVCVLGAIFVVSRADPWLPLASSVAVAGVLAAPAFALVVVATTGQYFQIPSRYGAILIPAFLLCGGLIIKTRWVSWLIIGYSAALLALGVWLSWYLATLAP